MTLPDKDNKREFVQEKFSSVTTKYDFLNSLLSLGIDHLWRKSTIKALSDINGPILDLCAGTLPLTKELLKQGHNEVYALDFCYEMLEFGIKKKKQWNLSGNVYPICADGEKLPFKENVFLGFTVAFGIRNLTDLSKGFSEMFRVLKPGGKGAILEFSRPTLPFFKQLYRFYLHNILPYIGGMISGDKEAYKYLASSIDAFYSQKEVCNLLQKAGFENISFKPMSLGIVTLYVCQRPKNE